MMSASTACPHLAATGLEFPVVAVVLVAIACLAVGCALLWAARRRDRRRVPVVLFLLLGVVALALGRQPSSAEAAGPGCVVAAPAFSVVQVSVITDLAPGVPAVGIEAVGTNTASSSIFVQMVVVRIASVTKAPLAAAGTCDATDYVVGSPDMLVNDDVTPGESVELTGSTIAFNSGTSNQDACKGATVHLSYDAYQL